MRHAGVTALALAVVAAAAGAAHGGFTPAWSYVPAPLRVQLARQAGGSLYLPARVPPFYRYRAGARVSGGALTVPFTNRVRVREGVWRWTRQTFLWQTRPLGTAADCSAWRRNERTQQVDGNKVYTASTGGAVAWRCVTDRSGRRLVLSASATTGSALPLTTAVASGLDVSRRTSSAAVALAVTPSTVRRGARVLVHGVAGGCTSGDTVTVISRAFSAAHTFAGVPAVFAFVGSAGRFSVATGIPSARAPGRYVVTARCGGGNLGVAAHLTVTR